MNDYASEIRSPYEEEFLPRNEVIFKNSGNDVLRICQASLLSTCVLLLSYYSVFYGQTVYSIMEDGEIVNDHASKAVLTFVLGYSRTYSVISILATGMLAYSLVSKDPRWSLPSMVLYLADLVYDVSGAAVAIWLFLSNFPLQTALSYTLGTVLLIVGEIWTWTGVLQLYEQRTFK